MVGLYMSSLSGICPLRIFNSNFFAYALRLVVNSTPCTGSASLGPSALTIQYSTGEVDNIQQLQLAITNDIDI